MQGLRSRETPDGAVARELMPTTGWTSTAGAAAKPAADSPLVSVVVGAYNHERFVATCLDSVVNGSYPNFEIIVFNDASTDGTDTAIRRWIAGHADLDVTYLNHDRNLGTSRSYNQAVAQAKGSLICPISADDVMMPDGISRRVAYLQQHPDKLAVFGDCHIIDPEGKPVRTRGRERGGLDSDVARQAGQSKARLKIDALMPYNIVFHWAISGSLQMCRKDAFQEAGGYDESLVIEDWDLFLRLAATGGLGFIDEVVSLYRVHTSNTSDRVNHLKFDEMAKVAKKNWHRFGPINGLRLAAIYVDWRRGRTESAVRRALLTAASHGMLFVSYRAYLLKRSYILRKQAVGTP